MGFPQAIRWSSLALSALVLAVPAPAWAGDAKAPKAQRQAAQPAQPAKKGPDAQAPAGAASQPASAGKVTSTQRTVGGKILRFDALKIEGEHETPDVIIIQEWTPPRDQVIEDKASDDLDQIFSGIRSLNREFGHELSATPDSDSISAESKARSEEQKLYQREKPRKADRSRKTSLR